MINLDLSRLIRGHEIRISVFDTAGKAIIRQKLSSSFDGIYEFKNTKSLQQGIYLLSVESKNISAKLRFVVI